MAQSDPVFQYILYNGSGMFFGLILNIRDIIFNTLDIWMYTKKVDKCDKIKDKERKDKNE